MGVLPCQLRAAGRLCVSACDPQLRRNPSHYSALGAGTGARRALCHDRFQATTRTRRMVPARAPGTMRSQRDQCD